MIALFIEKDTGKLLKFKNVRRVVLGWNYKRRIGKLEWAIDFTDDTIVNLDSWNYDLKCVGIEA